jgi:phospholipase/carboxylesterase
MGTPDDNPHLAPTPSIVGAPFRRARRAALVVHGRAQSPEYMQEALVSRLGLDDVAYVLPRAADGSWYPGRYHDARVANEPWIEHALQAISRSLDLLSAAGLGPDRVVLAGFSQGACIVCELVAQRPARYAGVAVLTGCLIGAAGEQRVPGETIRGVPAYFGTRELDEWIPAEDVRAASAAFARAGADVTLDVRPPGPHQVDEADVLAVRALLR